MNFASPYVYDHVADDSYEVVSDEEFLEGMDLSDSEEDMDDDYQSTQAPPQAVTAAADTTRDETDGAKPSSKPSMLNRVMGMLTSSSGSAKHAGHAASEASPPLAGHQKSSKSNRLHHWKSQDASTDSNQPGKRRVFRRADTNIVSLRFDTLKTPSTMHAGEVIKCSSCEAIMSHTSSIEEDGPDRIWKCEFCGHRNSVDIEEDEKPTGDDVTYLVEAGLSTAASGTSGRDESLVVFCIDISGSMTITTEVPGHQKLRGSATLRRLRRENTMEGPQRLPSEGHNVTYISRLQAVQAAVDHQLGEMAKDFPHRRVGLVTFSNDVAVIGDGTSEVVTVSGQKLMDREELVKVGSELASPKAIRDVRASLGEKIFWLEEGGATALGPAIVIALSLASRQPGSKLILCTDGKSNEGVGKVENLHDSDPAPEEFYDSIATTANAKGVSVSVITIRGTDCKLIQLGKLANTTGGQVNIVDPLKLTEEFSNVLADRIIATSVVATFILHKDLYIGQEENDACKERREIGNVNADHEISFEFGVRRRKAKEPPKPNPLDCISEVSTSLEENPPSIPPGSGEGRAEPADVKAADTQDKTGACAGGAGAGEAGAGEAKQEASDSIPSELPFQLQITYTDVDGTKALRVLTQKKPVTSDRNVAERDVDLNVLGLHTERRSSELALQGDYTGSRAVALMNQRLGWRTSHSTNDRSKKKVYHQVFTRVRTVENTVSSKQREEISTYGRTHSDDEDEEDVKELFDSAALAGDMAPPAQSSRINREYAAGGLFMKKKKKKARSEAVDDGMAHILYQARSSSVTTAFKQSEDKSPKKK